VNLLDEHVRAEQRELLRRWRLGVRQIGHDVGRGGMDDDEIVPLLHALPRPTLFTRDRGFYDRSLRHPAYCLVHLDVEATQVAAYVRRFLRHPEFGAYARRRGMAVRLSPTGVHVRRPRAEAEEARPWPS
jgi:hypothetical protein